MTSAAQPPGQDMTSIPAMKVTNSLSHASPSTTLNTSLNPLAPPFVPASPSIPRFPPRRSFKIVKVRNLNICQVNVRSILATTRLLDLEILCANHDIDILCVTETWLSTKSTPLGSSLITLPGYQSPFRRDRSGRRGGGVAMYVRNGITATVIPFQENIESSCVKVSLSKRRHIYIVTVYLNVVVDTTR